MERTRFFRRPVVWIVLVIIGAIAVSSLFSGGDGYKTVDYSTAIEQLNKGGVEKAIVRDKEETLQLELQTKSKFDGTDTDKIQAQFPAETADELWTKVEQAKAEGKITGT